MIIRYHPERYRIIRPFSKNLISSYPFDINCKGPTMEAMQVVMNLLLTYYNETLMTMPREERPVDTSPLSNEASFAMHYAEYYLKGRNIFHFSNELSEKFRNTDVDDIPLSMIKLPFDNFYISFGPQYDLNLWNQNYYVDGAYVSSIGNGKVLQILLTTIREDVSYNHNYNWIKVPDRYYYMSIDMESSETTLGHAIDKAFKEELDSMETSHSENTESIYFEGKQIDILGKDSFPFKKRLREKEGGYKVFKEALRLVVNGLCYITSYKQEISLKWPDDTPKSFLEALKNASDKKFKDRVLSKMSSMGYIKVNFCRDLIQTDSSGTFNSDEESKERNISAHWRRGHWRNQAHGIKYSEHKLMWIMPMLINPKENNSILGHIYSVE